MTSEITYAKLAWAMEEIRIKEIRIAELENELLELEKTTSNTIRDLATQISKLQEENKSIGGELTTAYLLGSHDREQALAADVQKLKKLYERHINVLDRHTKRIFEKGDRGCLEQALIMFEDHPTPEMWYEEIECLKRLIDVAEKMEVMG